MIAYRYFLPFIGLIAGLQTIQAQSFITQNTQASVGGVATSALSPRNPKAVESPFYLKAYGFYSLVTLGTDRSLSRTSTGFNVASKGLGAGPRIGGGIGFIISDFVNVGIDADLLLGDKLETSSAYKESNSNYILTRATTLKVLSFVPNITFKALSRPSYYIYNRLGLVGGLVLDYNIVQNRIETPLNGTAIKNEYTIDSRKNGLAVGYQVALGIQLRLSQHLRGFAELVAYTQSFEKREDLISSVTTNQNGTVLQSNLSISQYKSQGEYVRTTQGGIDVSQLPSLNVHISSVGLSTGLLFRF